MRSTGQLKEYWTKGGNEEKRCRKWDFLIGGRGCSTTAACGEMAIDMGIMGTMGMMGMVGIMGSMGRMGLMGWVGIMGWVGLGAAAELQPAENQRFAG